MKPLYLLLGVSALVVGIVGIVLPLVPTTGPLIIAAFAFSRSSDRMHTWLTNHRIFGRFITDFRAGRGIPRKTKIVAVVAMTAAFTYSIGWVIAPTVLQVLMTAIGIWAVWYVLHLPTVQPE
jgi:uncharacterized membrane protein YbaN (DUF454 family)